MIIPLAHMREQNDLKVAQKTSEGMIDLILGGHDHYYNHGTVKSTHVLRSGPDFRNLSYIEAWKKETTASATAWEFSITR